MDYREVVYHRFFPEVEMLYLKWKFVNIAPTSEERDALRFI